MKRLFAIAAVLLLLASCAGRESFFGFRKGDFTVVAESDTHGGFHGDGAYSLILDCAGNRGKAWELLQGWQPLPLSENLALLLYGGEKDGTSYAYGLAEEAHLPRVEHGFYCFYDRHSESTDPSVDTHLLDRGSFNFSLAIYDSDADRLYYFEYDT